MDSSSSVVELPVDIAVEQPVAEAPAPQTIEQALIVDQPPVDQVEAMAVDAPAVAAITADSTAIVADIPHATEVADTTPVVVAETVVAEEQAAVTAEAQNVVDEAQALAEAPSAAAPTTLAETTDASVAKAETPKNLTAISAAIRAKVKAPKKTPADTTKPKGNRITGKLLDKMIHSRQKADLHYHSRLFKSKKSVLLGKNGDVRHMDCETLSKIGPYETGTQFKVIDYIATANVMFMSQSGKIMDTVIMPLQPAAVEGETLIDPFAVSQ